MLIDGITNADATPVLERLMQFAGARHRVIVHNIANLDTPGFRPKDVLVEAFQAQLSDAIDARREKTVSDTVFRDSDEVHFTERGVKLNPQPIGDNILFHDGNDRDVERTMQDMVENFTVFRTAAQLLRSRYELINTAIRERM